MHFLRSLMARRDWRFMLECPTILAEMPILSFSAAAVRFSIMCPVLPLRKYPRQAVHGI
ncbi:hypothetical protein ANAPC5_01508 [Anaplasma phagocytophilum]|nr:hypothetical protein ANAPC5_01508 [Anaplasma phagocytophilum]